METAGSGSGRAGFADHFSAVAEGYALYRPRYPRALFDAIAARAARHCLAWDCATGSGQAATGLLEYFEHVVATDASTAQLRGAPAAPRLSLAAARAEAAPLAAGVVDVLTVGQALHWFQLGAFYRETRRVLHADGLIVAWTYDNLRADGEVAEIVDELYQSLTAYWPEERHLVEARYRDLPFPFSAVERLELAMQETWTLEQLIGYLGTWSAVKRFREQESLDPLQTYSSRLAEAWGEQPCRQVTWPLTVLCGRPG